MKRRDEVTPLRAAQGNVQRKGGSGWRYSVQTKHERHGIDGGGLEAEMCVECFSPIMQGMNQQGPEPNVFGDGDATVNGVLQQGSAKAGALGQLVHGEVAQHHDLNRFGPLCWSECPEVLKIQG